MRILLAAADVRLGVWLPSPARVRDWKLPPAAQPPDRPRWWRRIGRALRRRWRQPDLRHLWAEAAGSLHLDGRWLYVTDGGHYENLGMVEALRRRPDHLIVVDAAGDARGRFSTLGQAIALARSELGVQVRIDPSDNLRPRGDGLSRQAYATGSFSYGNEESTFPTDSTLQQLYDDQEFEAYRELGYHCAQAALRGIRYGDGEQAGDGAGPAVGQLAAGLMVPAQGDSPARLHHD